MAEALRGDLCKRCEVRSLTLMLSSKIRGIRCQINKSGVRIYEVANGSYQMNLKWYIEGKECSIKINIYDNGSIELIEGNDVTEEQLKGNNKVKIGKQHEAKSLHKVVGPLLPKQQQHFEKVRLLLKDVNILQPAVEARR
ncbi:MAG: hypothetical protein KTV77_05330 [Wolbachia endosymbiont of Fragariocoptes setiger]|nr:hypothetical protein [Wolbachia endosymbiont of Fragariocoptes setiger]